MKNGGLAALPKQRAPVERVPTGALCLIDHGDTALNAGVHHSPFEASQCR